MFFFRAASQAARSNLKEQGLNTKLRQGDRNSQSVYDDFVPGTKRKSEKSTDRKSAKNKQRKKSEDKKDEQPHPKKWIKSRALSLSLVFRNLKNLLNKTYK